MSERQILSEVFPAHADLQPILKNLREKYKFPQFGLADADLASFLASQEEIPWEEIQRDIRAQVEANPDFFPEQIGFVRKLVQDQPLALDDPEKLVEGLEITQEDVQAATAIMLKLIKPMAESYKRIVDDISKLLLVYLTTGETEDIPLDWLGAVFTSSIFGEPVVVAMASPLSDPKEIVARFTAEMHNAFGKDRPKVTKEFSNLSKYLRRRFEGVGLHKIADEYIRDNPKEFTGPHSGLRFRNYRRSVIERLKRALRRYEKKTMEIVGANSEP